MELKQGTMIEIEGINCCVLDKQEIKGETYIYVAEIVDEDITENFYVYKINKDNSFEKIVNSDELKEILPVFIESLS